MTLDAHSAPTETPAYSDEVLNASWLPQPALTLSDYSVQTARARSQAVADPETFLQRIYRVQE